MFTGDNPIPAHSTDGHPDDRRIRAAVRSTQVQMDDAWTPTRRHSGRCPPSPATDPAPTTSPTTTATARRPATATTAAATTTATTTTTTASRCPDNDSDSTGCGCCTPAVHQEPRVHNLRKDLFARLQLKAPPPGTRRQEAL